MSLLLSTRQPLQILAKQVSIAENAGNDLRHCLDEKMQNTMGHHTIEGKATVQTTGDDPRQSPLTLKSKLHKTPATTNLRVLGAGKTKIDKRSGVYLESVSGITCIMPYWSVQRHKVLGITRLKRCTSCSCALRTCHCPNVRIFTCNAPSL